MKTCIKCGKTEDETPFREGKNTCKTCEAGYAGNYAKENPDKTKTIYISDRNMPTYEEIEKQAKQDERGVGSFLCKVFREWAER